MSPSEISVFSDFPKFEKKMAKNHEKMPKIALKHEKQVLSKNVMDFHKILHFLNTNLI